MQERLTMLTIGTESLDPFARSRAEANRASNFSEEKTMRTQVIERKLTAAEIQPARPYPLSALMDQLEDLWRQILEAEKRQTPLEERMIELGFESQEVAVLFKRQNSEGHECFFNVSQIEDYFAPIIAVHGDTWIGIRDKHVASLRKIEAARAALGLDKVDAEIEALKEKAEVIEGRIIDQPSDSHDAHGARLRYALLIAKGWDPDEPEWKRQLDAEILETEVAYAERAAGGVA